MNNMDYEFVNRTKHILENYKDEYEFTLLINCTLGLIVLPIEVNKRLKLNFLQKPMNEIQIINEIFKKDRSAIFNPTRYNRKANKYVQDEKSLKIFLSKIRNSIAHFANSEPINEGKEWKQIKLKDINNFNNDNVELEISIDKNDLKKLALYITEEYLTELNNKTI